MPELPEVETMVRGVRERFVGQVLAKAVPCECRCRPILIRPRPALLNQMVTGQVVRSVERRAKRIVIQLENESAFVVEPRMTGLMLIDSPPDREHLRFRWEMKSGRRRSSVWFWDRRGLGTIRLLAADELEQQLGLEKIGPDALVVSPSVLHGLLQRTARPIKVALLDQKLIAGIGNLYASEILHRSGIHPMKVASQLSATRVKRLREVIVEVLTEAIQYEGSTLGDGTYRNALNQSGGYQNHHRVYDRAGEPCFTCRRGTIRRIVQSQRSTFYCPRCQK